MTDGVTTFQGRQAFCVNWVDVGYYAEHADRTNSFQLLLVDRSATGAGNFDIVMNYDRLVWETGDASDGVGGLGGTSAAAGYSSGSDGSTPATRFFQFPGSLDNGTLLDTNPTGLANTSTNSTVTGRHVFPVRGGTPVAGMRCTIMGTAGNDVLRGTPGIDIICGRSGNDGCSAVTAPTGWSAGPAMTNCGLATATTCCPATPGTTGCRAARGRTG